MTYRIKVLDETKSHLDMTMYPSWLHNSFRAVYKTSETSADFVFKEEYNISLIRKHSRLIYADFPSQEDAMMFILKWS